MDNARSSRPVPVSGETFRILASGRTYLAAKSETYVPLLPAAAANRSDDGWALGWLKQQVRVPTLSFESSVGGSFQIAVMPDDYEALVGSGRTAEDDASLPEPILEMNPWRGLLSYEEEHARMFFGREAVCEQALSRLEAEGSLVLCGSSGSGKSSLMRAGLVPSPREGRAARGDVHPDPLRARRAADRCAAGGAARSSRGRGGCDRRMVAGGGGVWDMTRGGVVCALNGHRGRAGESAFSRDGAWLVTADSDNAARLWDAQTGAFITAFIGHRRRITSVGFSSDRKRIATSSADGTVRIWDVPASSPETAKTTEGTSYAFLAAFSSDGSMVLTASFDEPPHIWDVRTSALVGKLRGGNFVDASFSPDAKLVITAAQEKTARVWDARTGAAVAELTGHTDEVMEAAFSPDGVRVATASRDNTARVWDARSGAELLTLKGHSARVFSAVFSPDGSRIVTASDDHTSRVWDAQVHL